MKKQQKMHNNLRNSKILRNFAAQIRNSSYNS